MRPAMICTKQRRNVSDSGLAVFTALIVLLFVAGCGGGGGGGSPAPAQPPADQGTNPPGPGPARPPTDPNDKGDFLVSILDSAHYADLIQSLREDDFENEVETFLNSTFALPTQDIRVFLRECGGPNAFYTPAESSITMCYELLFDMLLALDNVDRMALAFDFVFYHELAHALVDQLDLIFPGKGEDAADSIATYILVEIDDHAVGAIWGGVWLQMRDGGPWFDEHSSGEQRLNRLACYALGGDPGILNDPDVAVNVPGLVAGTESCVEQYQNQKRYAEWALGNYLKTVTPDGSQPPPDAGTGKPEDLGDFAVVIQDSTAYPNLPDVLRELGTAPELSTILNETFSLPERDINVAFLDCGSANAFYDATTSAVGICYELLADIASLYPDTDKFTATLVFVLYHELGHAFIDQLNLIFPGSGEDAADSLATFFLVEIENAAHAAIWGGYYLYKTQSNIDWFSEHSGGLQRINNLTCYALGGDPVGILNNPELSALLPLLLPGTESCVEQYQWQKRYALATIAPYIKPPSPDSEPPPQEPIGAPEISNLSIADNDLVSGTITISADLTDTSALASSIIYVDGEKIVEFSAVDLSKLSHIVDTRVFVDGVHSLTVEARNEFGNSATATVTFSIDNTAPTVIFDLTASGVSVGDNELVKGSLVITGDAVDPSSIKSIELFVDGMLRASSSGPNFEFAFNSTADADGPHEFTLRATDMANNVAERTITPIVDNNAPDISVLQPSAGSTVGGKLTLKAQVADSTSTVAHLTVLFDGIERENMGTLPDVTAEIDLTGLSGTKAVSIEAVDEAGNRAFVEFHINIDNDAPNINLNGITEGQVVSGTLTLSASASDPSGIISATFTLNNQIVRQFPAGSDFLNMAFDIDTSTLSDGPATLRLLVQDAQGSSNTLTRRFTIDNSNGGL